MKRNSIGVKLISLLLALGGAAGIGVFVWALSKARTGFLVAVSCALIFCWATWTGVELWRNKPRAYKSAMILFGLQIPIVSIPEFSYQFYTGLLFLVSFSSPANIGVEFHAASKIGVGIASGAEDVLVGINVIAVAALMWLIHVFPRRNARVAVT